LFIKKKDPKWCCFERHHTSSSSLGRAENRGRELLFPCVFHRLPLQKDADQKLYLAQLTRGLPGVGETEETCLLRRSWGGNTVAAPAMSLPCFPINTGETKRQGGEEEKKCRAEREEREQKRGRGVRKKKKQREEERRNKNEKKNKEKGRRTKQRRSCHQHRRYLEPPPPLAITDD